MSPDVALSGHPLAVLRCPLPRLKRTSLSPPRPCVVSTSSLETPGEASTASAACAGIFFSYQQLLRIATQPTTQHPHHIDIQGFFRPKHSLRDGFNGFLRALPGDRACLSPSSARCQSIVANLASA